MNCIKKIEILLRPVVGFTIACILLLGTNFESQAQVKGYEEYPYSELFTEGKEWTWCHYIWYRGEYYPEKLINVKVNGSSTIEGIECKRLLIEIQPLSTHCSCDDCCLWLRENFQKYGYNVAIQKHVWVYEKDRKIYYYKNPGIRLNSDKTDIAIGSPYFALLMDQNFSVGDNFDDTYIITGDELIDINGVPHRKISKNYRKDLDVTMNPEAEDKVWIEGIGATSGFPWNYEVMFPYYVEKNPDEEWMTGLPSFSYMDRTFPYIDLALVKDNGNIIYDGRDKLSELGVDVTSGIKTLETEEVTSDKCYDLQGRPIDPKNAKGLYIQNGKVKFNR